MKKLKQSYRESNIIGSRLKRSREKRGWTQVELARKCKFTPDWISHFEDVTKLKEYKDDPDFQARWLKVKKENN